MTPFDWTLVAVLALVHLSREAAHHYLKRKAQVGKTDTA